MTCRRHLMSVRVIGVGSQAAGKASVTLQLECGCVVERTVDPSRIIEVTSPGGGAELHVPGKFLCDRHS